MNATIKGIHAAPIEAFLKDRGFRRRGNRWACHAHDDKQPSCSLRNNRLHCWVCNRWWSTIDLAMELDGLDLKSAVRLLADFYAIPLQDRPLTPGERREYPRRRAQAERLARDVADWERGLELCLLRRLETAAEVTTWLLSQDTDPGELLINARRDLAFLRHADADSLVETYRGLPERLRRRFTEAGRRDRKHAETITRAIVASLASMPAGKEAAA